MKPIGLYVHFPFCASKCPYCDFYSAPGSEEIMDLYTDSVIKSIGIWQNKGKRFDTVYFGGGTPSLMGAKRLTSICQVLRDEPIREFTVECNPSRVEDGLFDALYASGVTRISMGLQSAVDAERRALGRTADSALVERRVEEAKKAGFSEISLDLMLAIPGQTAQSLRTSVDFCRRMDVTHVSAYLLKIEEGTPFYARRGSLSLPTEEEACDFYLQAVEDLAAYGYKQYEISNFAKPGHEGRHNLKYWDGTEYVGIGPAAHSFVDGQRFYYERSTEDFIKGVSPIPDGEGGGFEEYAMLRLRLSEGLTESGTRERFGHGIPQSVFDRAKHIPGDLLLVESDRIRLTPAGFLLSNAILAELLAEV